MSIVSIDRVPINFRLFQMIKEEALKKGQKVENFVGDLVIEGYIIYRKQKGVDNVKG